MKWQHVPTEASAWWTRRRRLRTASDFCGKLFCSLIHSVSRRDADLSCPAALFIIMLNAYSSDCDTDPAVAHGGAVDDASGSCGREPLPPGGAVGPVPGRCHKVGSGHRRGCGQP